MDKLEWLRSLIIMGREDDDDGDDTADDTADDDGQDDDDGDADGDDDSEDDGEESPEALRKALEASKSALREERLARRKAERDARKRTKKKVADKDDKDLQQTQQDLSTERDKTHRLAERLLRTSQDNAILAEARRQGFIDETDALLDSVRSEVDFEQDEEDPSEIELDEDSVKDAVEALAKKKPHLVGKNSDGTSTTQSGKRMGKKRRATDDETISEQKLLQEYPSLR